jgi:FkbH-like protein
MGSSPTAWRDFAKRWRQFAPNADGTVVGITSSFTANNLEAQLGTALVDSGWAVPQLHQGEFNQIHQACLAPEQHFGRQPDIVVVLLRLEDVFPKHTWSYIAGDETAAAHLTAGAAEIAMLAADLAGRGVRVVLTLPPTPLPTGVDRLDRRVATRASRIGESARTAMVEALKGSAGVELFDLEAVVAEIGRNAVLDDRNWLLYRQPYSTDFFHLLGIELARVLAQATRSFPKCIAVDCDNTLWGGVIGEDGLSGIELGEDFPGLAFQRFQQQLQHLQRCGVLLAAVSKNDEPAVFEVFDQHPGMVLSRDDFAAWRVNWLPKSENLRSLSDEFNFGLDAFVFIDDSNFEVAEVANALPEVTILQIPEETASIVNLLPDSGLFRNIDPTSDDLERTRRVKEESKRQLANTSLSPEEFLASLELRVEARRAQPQDMGRVTQLVNKTNQFNLTTLRRDEAELAALASNESYDVLVVSVEDRFGDYGLVGVMILDKTSEDAVELDTMLLSCRVLGRGVEFAALAAAAGHGIVHGRHEMRGRYLPTAKNGQVADFYERAGFQRIDEESFEMCDANHLECPSHIELSLGAK